MNSTRGKNKEKKAKAHLSLNVRAEQLVVNQVLRADPKARIVHLDSYNYVLEVPHLLDGIVSTKLSG